MPLPARVQGTLISRAQRMSARTGMMETVDALELIVDQGRPANAGRFFRLGNDLLVLLDELSDVPVAWQITSLATGSALATIAPPEGQPEEASVLRLAYSSLATVQGGGSLPDSWSPDAVRVAHRFVENGLPDEGEGTWSPPQLRLVSGADRQAPSIELTTELGEQLTALQPFERRMPGSVRGQLVGLNVSRGNRASLKLPNKRIVRVGFETSLRGDLKDALYQEVELRGLVRQDGDGRVFHVRADEVSTLAKPEVLWSQLFGIDPEFTGDLTTSEYLEANRGEA